MDSFFRGGREKLIVNPGLPELDTTGYHLEGSRGQARIIKLPDGTTCIHYDGNITCNWSDK